MIQIKYYKSKDISSVTSLRDHFLKNKDKQYISLYQIVQQDQQH